jgi:hypothetical protein
MPGRCRCLARSLWCGQEDLQQQRQQQQQQQRQRRQQQQQRKTAGGVSVLVQNS